jgi:hypothetical protein
VDDFLFKNRVQKYYFFLICQKKCTFAKYITVE